MFKSIRQSMAWLHGWLGLLLGWFMFVIFLTGATAYYKENINLWAEPKLVQYQTEPTQAIDTAYQYLQTNAQGAEEWYILPVQENKPYNRVWWYGGDTEYTNVLLDPDTGDEILLDSEQQLGEFLYRFHFQFYGIDIKITRLLVSVVAFMMLITLISGIITHKKIFSDFFTFRTFKSQRSWLDFHHVSSVVALPFFLVMTITGLMILFYVYFPQAISQHYQKNSLDYFKEIREKAITQPVLISNKANNSSPTMMDIKPLYEKVQQQWGVNAEIASINIKKPNTDQASIEFKAVKDDTITLSSPVLKFNAITGDFIDDTSRNSTPVAMLNFGMYGLHLAPFAQPFLKMVLFWSGILGCFMIASGLLLWSLKRQIRSQSVDGIGQYVVDRLNIATIAGLPLAIVASFIAVRLDSLMTVWGLNDFFGFPFIRTFFIVWGLSLVLSLLVSAKYKLWPILLFFIALGSLTLPIMNVIYLWQMDYLLSFTHYWYFLRVDIYFILLGIFAVFCIIYIEPIQDFSQKKLTKKMEQNENHQLTTQEKAE